MELQSVLIILNLREIFNPWWRSGLSKRGEEARLGKEVIQLQCKPEALTQPTRELQSKDFPLEDF